MSIIKKGLGAILIAAVLTLAGCKNAGGFLAPKAPDLNKKFAFSAALTYGSETISANFAREDIGKWTVEITEPYQIQGVTFSIDGSSISASFGGLTAESVFPSSFADSELSALIRNVESAVQDTSGQVNYNEDSYTVAWPDLLLSFPNNSGAPTAVEIPSLGIKGEISEFRVIGEITRGEVVIN